MLGPSINTIMESDMERYADEIAALQIKVSVLEQLLLSREELANTYNQMVDRLGVEYMKEREAARNAGKNITLSRCAH